MKVFIFLIRFLFMDRIFNVVNLHAANLCCICWPFGQNRIYAIDLHVNTARLHIQMTRKTPHPDDSCVDEILNCRLFTKVCFKTLRATQFSKLVFHVFWHQKHTLANSSTKKCYFFLISGLQGLDRFAGVPDGARCCRMIPDFARC